MLQKIPDDREHMSIFALPIHDRLTRETLDDLLAGEALAIWLKGFIPAAHGEHVYQQAQAAALKPLLVHYTREDGGADYHTHANVLRVGVDVQLDQYFDRLSASTDASATALESILGEYLSSVDASNEENRRLCAPYRRPCELLFDRLDEVCGIRVATCNGRPMKFGTFLLNRKSDRYDDPTTIPIHVDSVPTTLLPRIRAQLGAMVYCRVPEVGGELRVYDHPLIPRDEAIPTSVDHTCPYRALKPEAGDAVLINSRRPHAVIPGKDSDRLANIMFIGSDGSYPLDIWT